MNELFLGQIYSECLKELDLLQITFLNCEQHLIDGVAVFVYKIHDHANVTQCSIVRIRLWYCMERFRSASSTRSSQPRNQSRTQVACAAFGFSWKDRQQHKSDCPFFESHEDVERHHQRHVPGIDQDSGRSEHYRSII
nr:hypothetical protein [Burkholderia contaminans]